MNNLLGYRDFYKYMKENPDWNKKEKMNKKEIEFRDPIVERVVDKFVRRSDVGFAKYKVTLDEERTTGIKDLFKYLNDMQEEMMDAILYIQAAKEEISDLTEEALLRKFE